MLTAYSFRIWDTFFVTPALSTKIEFSFFIPSVAPLIASQSSKLACLPNAALSLNLIIIVLASSNPNHLDNKFFKEDAASLTPTNQSDVNSWINLFALLKSHPVPTTIDFNPVSAFVSLLLSSTLLFINHFNQTKATHAVAQIPTNCLCVSSDRPVIVFQLVLILLSIFLNCLSIEPN